MEEKEIKELMEQEGLTRQQAIEVLQNEKFDREIEEGFKENFCCDTYGYCNGTSCKNYSKCRG